MAGMLLKLSFFIRAFDLWKIKSCISRGFQLNEFDLDIVNLKAVIQSLMQLNEGKKKKKKLCSMESGINEE